MSERDRPRRSRRARILDALIWGAVVGAASGAALGASIDAVGAIAGALAGAVLTAAAELGGRLVQRRRPGPPPLPNRILASAQLMALLGGGIGLVAGGGASLFVAILSGALVSLLGLRPLKLALGVATGAATGLLAPELAPAVIAAVVTVAYRTISAFVYRNRPLTRIMAEEVPASQLLYVVPFEARTKIVGADYVEQLAKTRGGTFGRNLPDVGIIASLDDLAGPAFEPGRVHPPIRHYEIAAPSARP